MFSGRGSVLTDEPTRKDDEGPCRSWSMNEAPWLVVVKVVEQSGVASLECVGGFRSAHANPAKLRVPRTDSPHHGRNVKFWTRQL